MKIAFDVKKEDKETLYTVFRYVVVDQDNEIKAAFCSWKDAERFVNDMNGRSYYKLRIRDIIVSEVIN